MKKNTTFKVIIILAIIVYIAEIVVIFPAVMHEHADLIHLLMSIMYILAWVVVIAACYYYKRRSFVTFLIAYSACGIALLVYAFLFGLDIFGAGFGAFETFAFLSLVYSIPLFGFEYILENDILGAIVYFGIYIVFLIAGIILRRKIVAFNSKIEQS
jgi:hypothetical protein